MPVIENYSDIQIIISNSALKCHLAAAFCFIIKIYFIVSKTLLLPMSKDMNMKIIKMTTQLCSRFGAHPHYCAARAEMVLVQQCHRNRKTESSNIKYQTHISLKGRELFISIRVFHITPFFELGYTLLTTHALGLYEFTKKISAL